MCCCSPDSSAAFFTRPAFTVHGPTTMEELKEATICVAEPFYNAEVDDFTKAVVTPPVTVADLSDRFAFCHEKLKSREVDAWYGALSRT